MEKQYVISVKTIVTTLLILLAAYIVYRLGPVFAILLISTLIMLALEPLVGYFMKFHIWNKPVSRSLAVILTYAIFIVVIAVVITIGLPPVITQVQRLVASLVALIASFSGNPDSIRLSDFIPQLGQISGNVFRTVTSGFVTLTSIFSIIMISLYMSLDWINIKERLLSLFKEPLKEEMTNVVEEVETNVGHWVKGQLVLMLVIGVLSFFGLWALGVDYPLALALIAGLLEAVPILGPVISAVLASVIGFSQDPIIGLAVLGFFTILQQLENNILVPKIMQRVSGFSPLVILIALIVGSNFFGVMGAIVAIPITMILVIVVKSVLRHTS
ncbi:MAG: hypothetical protein UU77_C0043G0002 [candidate division WWE3 bacterium GW2011_GWC1_41_7]|uniref:Permease n=4 Tax=Katanobacteria TaxID=422282 RepID=A0A0G0X788_UNCKA|nr:MAG: hypothetical protein UU72_C0027G0005 [candidate division WWE3 bacterium GW2011_GWB1_41_6]KKS19609.1 MAG: hypothetical protein UU77_C0043G0002 [candidate division WWE3 bacterium GW2011_GWC1_41_7]KKS20939.1 MAG: hypothetical protein UU80_C0038G0006 [candidate division WWE3 bacterium GW2011_GWA1_41_8]OGC57280.1 MAG: hypothetical protein A2976_02610 [candidate division WWE3 bacterium RIFCSPLOWO2_01_FULL_41_9]